MREIVFRSGQAALRARLLDTPTADLIWQALPIYSDLQISGQEIYFPSPVRCSFEPEARDIVQPGEIAYRPEDSVIAIVLRPNPRSPAGEIRWASRANIWALSLDDVGQLKSLCAGGRMAVLMADS